MLVRRSSVQGSGYETGFRSALEILARRDFCDLPFRRTYLDLVGRPDQQAHGGAVAGMAAVETVSSGPDPGGSGLGALSSRPGTPGGRCGDTGRLRTSAWRAGADSAARHVGWHYRAWRCVARQSP